MIGTLMGGGGLALGFAPRWAPVVVGVGVLTTVVPWVSAWRGTGGTALRPAVTWAGIALLIGLGSQVTAWWEPLESGRPIAGHLVYLSVLSAFAALVSVLNARRPGGGAWAILMALLVLVFLIPWLEGAAWARQAHGLSRLRLDAPWSLFYVLIVIAGVTNYLPTRYGLAALWLGVGFALEYLALTRSELRVQHGARLWSVFPSVLSVSAWIAWWRVDRAGRGQSRIDATWLWFRDHWGVVWALRVQERFNRTAESLHWPLRLGWYGVSSIRNGTAEESATTAKGAESTLISLLRRFADPDRIERARGSAVPDPCQARVSE